MDFLAGTFANLEPEINHLLLFLAPVVKVGLGPLTPLLPNWQFDETYGVPSERAK